MLNSWPETTQLLSPSAGTWPITCNDLCPEPLTKLCSQDASSDPVLSAGDSNRSKTQSLSLRSSHQSVRGQTQRQINWIWPNMCCKEENTGWGRVAHSPRNLGGLLRGGGPRKLRGNWPDQMDWKGPLGGGNSKCNVMEASLGRS